MRRVWGGEKNGKIYLNWVFKYIFLFVSKTGCFRLHVIFQGLKTVRKYKIGSDLVRFELKTAKRAKSIGRASYAEAKKKCGTGFEKANRASKRRVAFRLLCVIAAFLPVLKPAEFAFLLRQMIRIQERHWRTAAAKSGGIWCILRAEAFVSALTSGCFLSRLVHFSFRIAVIECN